MKSIGVIPGHVAGNVGARHAHAGVALRYTRSYCTLHHRRSTYTLSRQAPRSSVDSLRPLARTTLVNASAVNRLPWSVFTISGAPCQTKAYSITSLAWTASSVIATLCASTHHEQMFQVQLVDLAHQR